MDPIQVQILLVLVLTESSETQVSRICILHVDLVAIELDGFDVLPVGQSGPFFPLEVLFVGNSSAWKCSVGM